MALTDIKVRNAKPKDRPYKLYDEKGLYVIVTPSGGKWWRLDYTHRGKRKTMSLGVYPAVALKDAREKRDNIRKLISEGVDPSIRKSEGQEGVLFGTLSWDWFTSKKSSWAERHAETVEYRIKAYVIPTLGKRPVSEITTPEIFRILQEIQKTSKYETAHRVKQIISMIFRYGIVKGIADRDPAADLGRGMLITPKKVHRATILDPDKIGALLRAIDGYESIVVRYALKLLVLTFVRPGELRHAMWDEIDFNSALWLIPAEKMKMRRPHVVPLSEQALSALRSVKIFTGIYPYVFPSTRGKDRPISDVTMNAALRRMGYDTRTEITSHGFRAMARTILHERLGFAPEVIEHQLAHAVPDNLGEAYNRTKFLEERKKMMQVWADYLDSLRESV